MSALALPVLIVMLIWLAYKATTHALPCLIGLFAARFAFETGAGWVGACVVFGLVALVTFALMRWLFASVTQPVARLMLSIAFIAPSVVISYFILNAFSAGHVPSELWRQALCVSGAVIVGLMAFVQLAEPEPK